jgi:acetyl-CoA C-acetyltransferase
LREIAILGFARTPFAPQNGGLREVLPERLGAAALVGAFERSGVEGAPARMRSGRLSLERLVTGSVLGAGRGPNPGRALALEAGWEEWDAGPYALSVRAGGASGLEALAVAASSLDGDACAAAVGVDSASLAPYLMPEARHGSRLGHARLLDGALKDTWDTSDEVLPLPALAAVLLQPLGLDRAKFLETRRRSVERARAAAGKGELVHVGATSEGKERTVESDELAGERPVSPGDEAYAASLADGAAAVVIATVERARTLERKEAPRVLAWARATVESRKAPIAPVLALGRLLRENGKHARELAVIEVDESLYVAPETARRELEIPEERLNPRGGAHAYGHAGGACGLRALVAALAELEAKGGGLGAVAYGAGGGAGVALLVKY